MTLLKWCVVTVKNVGNSDNIGVQKMKVCFRQNSFRHTADFRHDGPANSLLYHGGNEEVAKCVRAERRELCTAGELAAQGGQFEPSPFFIEDIGPAIPASLIQGNYPASAAFANYRYCFKVRAYASGGKFAKFLASQSRITEKANHGAFLFGSHFKDLTIFFLGYYSLTRWLFSKIIDLCYHIRKVMEILKVAIEGADCDHVGVFGVVRDF